ncbi:MAG: PhnD/SsuA/transferrin family substrate-binding protein [Streptosporangiales bacterium]|nr:PhnD/SsuA/transferrin family substrate-binding protein [Streptosporangiales bacterium]
MNKSHPLRKVLAACAAVLLLTTSCGGGGSEEDGVQELDFGITSFNALHLPLLMAREENLMRKYGIDLKFTVFQDTGKIIPALLSGSLDIATATPQQAFSAQDKEPDLKMIGAEVAKNPYSMYASSGIDSLADIKGKTIGVAAVRGSADYFTAKLLLKAEGLKEKRDYNFINAGPPPQRASALLEGQVDAVMSFPPDSEKLADEGVKSIATASEVKTVGDEMLATIMAKESWYSDEDNHEFAVKFLRGYRAAVDWTYDAANKGTAISIIQKEMKVSKKHATITYETFVEELQAYPKDVLIGKTILENTAENAKLAGAQDPPTSDSLPDRYDNSLVKEAAKK